MDKARHAERRKCTIPTRGWGLLPTAPIPGARKTTVEIYEVIQEVMIYVLPDDLETLLQAWCLEIWNRDLLSWPLMHLQKFQRISIILLQFGIM
jgi:hypothetical protein